MCRNYAKKQEICTARDMYDDVVKPRRMGGSILLLSVGLRPEKLMQAAASITSGLTCGAGQSCAYSVSECISNLLRPETAQWPPLVAPWLGHSLAGDTFGLSSPSALRVQNGKPM